jgi:Predicted methyltransferase regulatory domain
MPSSEVARALSGAGLEFGAPAIFENRFDAKGLDCRARELISRVAHPVMRETVFDYLANRRFRRDIFVKRGRPRDARPLYQRVGEIPFILLQHPEHVPGDFDRDLVDAMAAGDFRPKTLQEVATRAGCASIPPEDLAAKAIRLTEAGYLHPAQPSRKTGEAGSRCKALNARILERTESSGAIHVLASPVTGAGVEAARQEMLFLRALSLGLATEDEWAQHAFKTLCESDLAALRLDARAFARFRLPVFRALGIA